MLLFFTLLNSIISNKEQGDLIEAMNSILNSVTSVEFPVIFLEEEHIYENKHKKIIIDREKITSIEILKKKCADTLDLFSFDDSSSKIKTSGNYVYIFSSLEKTIINDELKSDIIKINENIYDFVKIKEDYSLFNSLIDNLQNKLLKSKNKRFKKMKEEFLTIIKNEFDLLILLREKREDIKEDINKLLIKIKEGKGDLTIFTYEIKQSDLNAIKKLNEKISFIYSELKKDFAYLLKSKDEKDLENFITKCKELQREIHLNDDFLEINEELKNYLLLFPRSLENQKNKLKNKIEALNEKINSYIKDAKKSINIKRNQEFKKYEPIKKIEENDEITKYLEKLEKLSIKINEDVVTKKTRFTHLSKRSQGLSRKTVQKSAREAKSLYDIYDFQLVKKIEDFGNDFITYLLNEIKKVIERYEASKITEEKNCLNEYLKSLFNLIKEHFECFKNEKEKKDYKLKILKEITKEKDEFYKKRLTMVTRGNHVTIFA